MTAKSSVVAGSGRPATVAAPMYWDAIAFQSTTASARAEATPTTDVHTTTPIRRFNIVMTALLSSPPPTPRRSIGRLVIFDLMLRPATVPQTLHRGTKRILFKCE